MLLFHNAFSDIDCVTWLSTPKLLELFLDVPTYLPREIDGRWWRIYDCCCRHCIRSLQLVASTYGLSALFGTTVLQKLLLKKNMVCPVSRTGSQPLPTENLDAQARERILSAMHRRCCTACMSTRHMIEDLTTTHQCAYVCYF